MCVCIYICCMHASIHTLHYITLLSLYMYIYFTLPLHLHYITLPTYITCIYYTYVNT